MKGRKHLVVPKKSEKMLHLIMEHFGCVSESEAMRLAIMKTSEAIKGE